MTPKTIKRQPCLVYSRVTGYYSNLNQWNEGKISEWKMRKTYKIKSEQI